MIVALLVTNTQMEPSEKRSAKVHRCLSGSVPVLLAKFRRASAVACTLYSIKDEVWFWRHLAMADASARPLAGLLKNHKAFCARHEPACSRPRLSRSRASTGPP